MKVIIHAEVDLTDSLMNEGSAEATLETLKSHFENDIGHFLSEYGLDPTRMFAMVRHDGKGAIWIDNLGGNK